MNGVPWDPDTTAYPRPSAITPAIWWVGRCGWGALPALTTEPDCNIYLLRGDNYDVLIDCGMSADLAALEEHIRAAGSAPARVREIWLTHSHYDHFMRAAHWSMRYPDTVCRIVETAIAFFQQDNYRLVGHTVARKLVPVAVPPRLAPLRDGEELRCPPWTLRVEALPGHVPDQLGFRGSVGGHHTRFSGDAVIGDQNTIPGMIGWLDGLWLSDLRVYPATVRYLMAHPPELLLPGHGRPQAGAAAARSLEHCRERLERFAAFPDLAAMMPIAPPEGDTTP